jgi:Alkylmercury lyase
MDQCVLVAHGREFERWPLAEWQAAVRGATHKMRDRLAFMTVEHHAVRNFAVTGLPEFQRALSLAQVAAQVSLPAARAEAIIDELERNLFFLVRNAAGEVAWAFPVTADRTPHELQFSTGERTCGACAEDAFAVAFVLGRLLHRKLSVDIQSVCGLSGRPVCLAVGSDLSWHSSAEPLLFVPSVDWERFRAPNIIDDY